MPDGSPYFDLSVVQAIAQIRFTRPDLHNAFDDSFHTGFTRVLPSLAGRQDIAALIISAEGKSFSAGGDWSMVQKANQSRPMRERLDSEAMAIVDSMLALPFPVIAAVQGAAIGLGASIVSLCDIVVAWRAAKIADPHVVLGLVAGDGGVMGWSQAIGIMRAKRYLLTGERITAEHAYAMGLVTDLVDSPDDALPRARAIARHIAGLPRGGVRGTKKAFSRLSRDLYGAAFALSLAYEMETLGSAEVLAAVTAMRPPR